MSNYKSKYSGPQVDAKLDEIAGKQDTLVSGTNIKTINGNSVLGSGDLTISGGLQNLVDGEGEGSVRGKASMATHNYSTALGYGTITNDYYQLVTGIWNINELASDKLFIIGNGTDGNNRSNAFTVDESGNVDIASDASYKINGIPLSASDVGAQETLVSGMNIKTINNNSLLGSGNISVLNADSTLSAAKLTGAITNGVTATTQSSGDNSTKIATTAYVDGAIANLPEPMVFEGSLGEGGTISTLPTASSTNKGFTYKVITDGTYASQVAKVGDTFISDGTAWVLVPSGDEPSGTVTSVATGAGLTGGPITTSGTISLATAFGDTVNPYGSKTANYILAAPNGESGVPTFRALVAADLPNGNWLNGAGVNSVALQNTIAQRKAQTVIGEYNIADTTGSATTRGDYVFIIGNGTGLNARSNAFAFDWQGEIEIALDTTAASGTDKEIYDALVSLGWDSDVIV